MTTVTPMPGGNLSVLVADDDPFFRGTLARKLREAGCAVEECPDGTSAMGKLQKQRYDAVLLDYRMPGKSGLDVLAGRASTRSAASPFFIITSMEGEFQNDDAKSLGADHIFFKSDLKAQTMATDILGWVGKKG